ncbi:glycosyl transferase [Bacteroidia bacterium]|nr:glycosyl transferase [Bacteroidia bacterium]
MIAKDNIVIIHPAIAPYRIDLFNSINDCFNASFYFQYKNPLEQKFNAKWIQSSLKFSPQYFKRPFFKKKNLHFEIFSILYKEHPDYVLCSEYNILDLFIVLYKFLFNRKVKIVSLCDDSYLMASNYKGLKKNVRDILLHLYDGVVLTDKNSYSWYKENYDTYTRFYYFPIIQDENRFAIDLDKSKPRSCELYNEYNLEGKRIFLFVGRLVGIKNVAFLLDIFSTVVAKFSNSILIIVGDGNQKELLIEIAYKLNIENHVMFAGKQEGNELYAWYRLSHFFILPSLYEPFGAVTNEALLSNCYVFCSNRAGSASIINEPENGALFDPEDKEELTGKILSYVKENPEVEKDFSSNRMQLSFSPFMTGLVSFIKYTRP